MAVFKDIGGGHTKGQIPVNTPFTFEWTSGSSLIDGFNINLAIDPTTVYSSYPTSTNDLGPQTNSGSYAYPLFYSVKNLFFDVDIYDFYPSHSMFVWNVGSLYFGERIEEGSFRIDIDGDSDYIQDDKQGNLKLNGSGATIGRIFYENGLACVQRDSGTVGNFISGSGMGIQNGGVVTTTFNSTLTIYEHTIVCNIEPSEYNLTANPTAFQIISGSTQTYNNYISSGSANPYITSIGLYNAQNELLATAKLSGPLTRTKYTDQTFIIKFDE
jgi:hypothetical protein